MTIDIAALPFTLSPTRAPWEFDPENATLTVTAPAYSDIFIDPGADGQLSSESRLNAATLLGRLRDRIANSAHG